MIAYDVLVRIAEGLGVVRGLMGLAHVNMSDHAGDIVGSGGTSVVRDRLAELEHRDQSHAVQTSDRGAERDAGVVSTWTGAEIRALRRALRLTVRDFGHYLG